MSDEDRSGNPTDRHELRYFQGVWTSQVSGRGVTSADLDDEPMIDADADTADTGEFLVGSDSESTESPRWGFPPGHVIVTSPTSNWAAAAALGAGMLSVLVGIRPQSFFLALVSGTIALVLATLGWYRTRAGGQHKWMAIAGGVLGVAGLALGVIGAATVDDDSEDLTSSFEFEPLPGDTYRVDLESCGHDDTGHGEAKGTITNTTDSQQDFFVTVYFLQEGVRVGEASDFVTALGAGESSTWNAIGLDLIPDGVLCETIVT